MCPDLETLEQFARDALPAAERQSVEAHRAGCAACRERLLEVQANLRVAERAKADAGGRRYDAPLPPGADEAAAAAEPTLRTDTSPGRATFVVRRNTSSRTSQPSDRPAELVAPQQLGPVRLVREIGRGGMGAVFLGHDQLLRRDVAVKLLLDVVSGPEDPGFERFLQGARAAAKVQHPGLTTIYQADLLDSGAGVSARVPYLVMQYIDGPTLAADLQEAGRLSFPAALAAIGATAEAVAALHEADIVHRDIKPQNVLLDPSGRVYVTDFGLMLDRSAGPADPVLAGTIAYMAPEMFDGVVSPRSDVYALGIMSFELLTGELPFRAGTGTEWRRLHRDEPLPVEPLRAASVDAALIEVLERATHKNAMFRYKAAGQFMRAVRDACGDGTRLSSGASELAALACRTGRATAPVAPDQSALERGSSYYDQLHERASARSRDRVAPPIGGDTACESRRQVEELPWAENAFYRWRNSVGALLLLGAVGAYVVSGRFFGWLDFFSILIPAFIVLFAVISFSQKRLWVWAYRLLQRRYPELARFPTPSARSRAWTAATKEAFSNPRFQVALSGIVISCMLVMFFGPKWLKTAFPGNPPYVAFLGLASQ